MEKYLQIILAILLGISVLMLSSFFMIIVSSHTNLFNTFPILEKTFTHIAMIVFSILLILIINKGNLKEYGFVWNTKFSWGRIVLLSLLIGMIPSIISKLFLEIEVKNPAEGFTLIEKIIFIWIWASICEEILTRGLIQGFLSPYKNIGINFFNKKISLPVIIGAIFFGTMHLMLLNIGVDFFSVFIIAIFGVILGLIAGYQKEKTDSLIPAIIVHVCFNIGASLSIFIYSILL